MDPSVILHSSWRGIFAGGAGSGAMLVAGAVVVANVGWRIVPATAVFVGVVLLVVVLFDYPVAASFDADGVTRRMLLRRHRLTWDRVQLLSRTRPGLVPGPRKLAHGGLVAVVGRRRYLLVDRCESLDEYESLQRVVGDRAAELMATTPQPHVGAAPTWLHRRAKWAPTSHGDR